jgi:hypothetical protein
MLDAENRTGTVIAGLMIVAGLSPTNILSATGVLDLADDCKLPPL